MRKRFSGVLPAVLLLTSMTIGQPSSHGKASLRRVPLIYTHVGHGSSRWFHLAGGGYAVSERNRPLGCVDFVALVGTNEYPMVSLRPNFLPHLANFHRGGGRWAGWTAHLVTGTYRIEARRVTATCHWAVRVAVDR